MATYNPLDPATRRDPYACYAELRGAGRVLRNELLGMWMLPHYEEVRSLLKDPRLSARRVSGVMQRTPETGVDMEPLKQLLSSWLLFQDEPDHTRLRSLVHRAFTPRFVSELRPKVQQLCDRLLEPALAAGEIDVLQDLANPLPFEVIAEMLGIPTGERELMRSWSDGLAALLGSLRPTREQGIEAQRCAAGLQDYLEQVIEERRRQPADDLISHLVRAVDDGSRLTNDEVLGTCALLFLAGHETTTNLIGNGVLALLQAPDQLALLRDDPGLLPSAIEELLRFDSPVQFVTRIPMEPVAIGDVTIAAGEPLLLFLGSAHRDPEAFTAPDRLDVQRSDNRHLAFGLGAHFCLGAALARLEADVVFSTLLQRCASLELATSPAELNWRADLGFRGVGSLPLRLAPQ